MSNAERIKGQPGYACCRFLSNGSKCRCEEGEHEDRLQERIKELEAAIPLERSQVKQLIDKFVYQLKEKNRRIEEINERDTRIKELEAEVERLKAEREDNEYFHAASSANSLIAACRVENGKQLAQLKVLRAALGGLDAVIDFGVDVELTEDGGILRWDDPSGINQAFKKAKSALAEADRLGDGR